MAEDYYEVLGVSRNASGEEIRKAHRKLSREYHPDVKPDDKAAAEKFKKVQEAYSVLSDPEKKQKYDRFGHAGFQGGAAGGGGGFPGGGFAGGAQVDLGDLFGEGFDLGDLFGGGGGFRRARGGSRGPRAQKGPDTETSIEIPFTTAAEGGSYGLTVNTTGTPEHLTVKIPPGVDTGSVIRLAGQGRPGIGGGPHGDLLVRIKVASHPYFRREGFNILVDVPVTMTEAALGAKVDVPTLSEGTVTLTVPPGSSGRTRLRLRGKGILNQKTGDRGDQFVVLKITVPKELDDRSRELLEEFAKLNPENPREGLW